jgi:ATP-dependent Clp protease adaptor protein ClpS
VKWLRFGGILPNFGQSPFMNLYKDQTGTKLVEEVLLETDLEKPCQLIVWNDEVNSFEWVIETLVEVCKHNPEQAEQCAMIIHTQGKYAVKYGQYEELKSMCDAITERGINATVEMTVE